MALARSRITAQGQVSVPAEVRRKLGVGPSSTIEWIEEGDRVVVRRLGEHTSDDVHRALFPAGVPRVRTLTELRKGLEAHARRRHARR